MAQTITSISFNTGEPALPIYKKKFEEQGNNFSQWVKMKLVEEAERDNDPTYLRHKLSTQLNQKAQLESDIALTHKQLDKVLTENSVTTEKRETDMEKVKKKLEAFTKTILEDFEMPYETAYQLADLYYRTPDRTLREEKIAGIFAFVKSKGHKPKVQS